MLHVSVRWMSNFFPSIYVFKLKLQKARDVLSSISGSLLLSSSYISFLYFFGCFCLKYSLSLLKYSCCCCFWYCWYLCLIFSMFFLIRYFLLQQNRNFFSAPCSIFFISDNCLSFISVAFLYSSKFFFQLLQVEN